MSGTIPTVELREVWVVSNPEHCVRGLGCTRDEALAAAANHYSDSVPACFELSGTDATFASNGWYVIRIPLAIPPAAPVPPVVTEEMKDAGARALCDGFRAVHVDGDEYAPFDDCTEEGKNVWRGLANLTLTAALRPERGEEA